MEFATFGANGMTCGVCVTSVSKTLRALPGVSDVPVSLADHRIDLKFDERRASVDAMRDTSHAAGYEMAGTAAGQDKAPRCCCS